MRIVHVYVCVGARAWVFVCLNTTNKRDKNHAKQIQLLHKKGHSVKKTDTKNGNEIVTNVTESYSLCSSQIAKQNKTAKTSAESRQTAEWKLPFEAETHRTANVVCSLSAAAVE